MGYLRGTLPFVLLGVVSLAGCSADVSHPSALGSASSAPPAAAPRSPVAVSAPISRPPSPATSSATSVIAGPSPTTSGTPTSAASGTPTSDGSGTAAPTSADVIATNVRATARAFIDDFNIAFATGDTTRIEALTSATCGCRQLVNTIKQHSAKGERYDGVVLTLKSIDGVNFLAAGASAQISYSISAGLILDHNGKQVGTDSATPDGHSEVFVNKIDGQWIVYQNVLLGNGNI